MAKADVQILIKAKDQASKELDKVGKSTGKFNKIAKAAAVTAGVALAAGLAKAVSVGAEFESQMADISTLISGDSTEAMGELEDGIKSMMSRVPKSAKELGASAYQIVSAGISDTGDALLVLEDSAKLATSGLSTTEEATDIMTSALNAFGLEAKDSNKVSDILFKTVKNGKTTISEMSQAFGATAPVIAAAGIKLEEFSAATAALTTTGLPASQAQNALRQAVVSLQKPTKEMAGLLKDMGYESGTAAIEHLGLQGTMEIVKEAADGDAEALARAWSSVEALTAATALSGPQLDIFKDTLYNMTDGGNAVDEAFNKQKDTFDNTVKMIKNKLEVAMLNLSDIVIPQLKESVGFLEDAFDYLNEDVEETNGQVSDLSVMITSFIEAITMAILIVMVLLKAIAWLAVAIGEDLGDKIWFIIDMFQKWRSRAEQDLGKIMAIFRELKHRIISSITAALNFVRQKFDWVKNVVLDALRGIGSGARSAFDGIGQAARGMFNGVAGSITAPFRSAFNAIRSLWNNTIGGFSVSLPSVGPFEGASFTVPNMANGSVNFGGGLAVVGERGPELVNLPRGARVNSTPEMGTGNTTNIYGSINLGSSQAVDKFFDRIDRQQELARFGI